MKIRIGVGAGGASATPAALAELVTGLDELGFDSLWLSEVLTGPVLVQVAVEIAHEGVGESIGEGLEPGLGVVVAGDVGQGLRAVVGHAHQNRRAPSRRGASDDRERALHCS